MQDTLEADAIAGFFMYTFVMNACIVFAVLPRLTLRHQIKRKRLWITPHGHEIPKDF